MIEFKRRTYENMSSVVNVIHFQKFMVLTTKSEQHVSMLKTEQQNPLYPVLEHGTVGADDDEKHCVGLAVPRKNREEVGGWCDVDS